GQWCSLRDKVSGEIGTAEFRIENNEHKERSPPHGTWPRRQSPARCVGPEAQHPDTSSASPTRLCYSLAAPLRRKKPSSATDRRDSQRVRRQLCRAHDSAGRLCLRNCQE